jgi:hypothetical protein
MTIVSNLPALAVLGKGHGGGTSLQGTVRTTYQALCVLLGEPHERNGDKVTVSWCFELNNGESFTVYDWKETATPAGEHSWSIGGNSSEALAAFQRFTGLRPVSTAF